MALGNRVELEGKIHTAEGKGDTSEYTQNAQLPRRKGGFKWNPVEGYILHGRKKKLRPEKVSLTERESSPTFWGEFPRATGKKLPFGGKT